MLLGWLGTYFSFNIDQSISFNTFNIVNVLVQSKHRYGVSAISERGQGVLGTMVSPQSPRAGGWCRGMGGLRGNVEGGQNWDGHVVREWSRVKKVPAYQVY
ncbi:hypothetical protein K435DRAFT_53305 [Dendrothele bispora CBS 962.96]|uniref:Uncharacterized protein n=1 Tax=Dendrothele bispora (strain CBS 962.96) TaxID=1314807 RepID=A0A4S8KSX4_DENBC|nr:hypothetical protein K435DRAFT_53305 [Dendrothele bispora CBS 962.96]